METKSNLMKKNLKHALCFLFLTLIGLLPTQAATIGFGSAFGTFLDKDGNALTAGGVSVGFFTKGLPTAAAISALTNNTVPVSFSSFQSEFGYVDVRTLKDSNGNFPTYVSNANNYTWDFTSGWTGATLTVPNPPSNAPSTAYDHSDSSSAFAAGSSTGTALWAIAYNAGNYANGYDGSTQWAVVTATAPGLTSNDWIYPSSTENIQLSQINVAGEIVVGTDGANVLGGNASNVYLVIPEPNTSALLVLGLTLSMGLRKKRSI